MTRPDLMAAVVAAFGTRGAAAAAIGCTPQMVGKIINGQRPLTDDLALAAIAALEDRAERLDRLAVALREQMITRPVRSRRGTHPRDERGFFA